MTNMVEPRGAAHDGEEDHVGTESELASLVRRWMVAGNRGRREGLLRVAPQPQRSLEPEATTEPEPTEPVPIEPEPIEPVEPEPVEPEPVGEPETARRVPALPHRPTTAEAEHATRLAVLIDARGVSDDVAVGLLARLDARGSVNVCRAYADWSRAELGEWVGRLRRQGLHSFHQFASDDDQALVAMAIDAVDIAREAAVDEMVLAGDMTSMLPLVHRLHAAGVRVVLVGPAHTPHDVRAACDEFLPADSLAGEVPVVAGRHRA